MIFQSIGAHYTFRQASAHLFARGSSRHHEKLRDTLTDHYNGVETILYHKGRSALSAAIRQATGGTGKVAVSGLTCYSVPQAVWSAGCEVIYVDIDSDYLQPTAKQFSAALDAHPDIKVFVIQNMLGIPIDIRPVETLASQRHVTIIEDLAHSAGSSYEDGREVGTIGDFTMLSFGKDKALDTVNGGALVVRSSSFQLKHPTRTPPFADQFRDRLYPILAWWIRALYPVVIGKVILSLALRTHIITRSAEGPVDTDITLPSWQANRAINEITTLNEQVAHRRLISAKIFSHITSPYIPHAAKQHGASLIRIPLLLPDRDKLFELLDRSHIHLRDTWYDVPVSPRRTYETSRYDESACPVATRVASEIINIPTHRGISPKNLQSIIDILHQEGIS